jgi:hypothetical protein
MKLSFPGSQMMESEKLFRLLDSHFLFTIHNSSEYVLFPSHLSLALIGHLALSALSLSSL